MANGIWVAFWNSVKPILSTIIEDLLGIILFLATSSRNENVLKKKDAINFSPYQNLLYKSLSIVERCESLDMIDPEYVCEELLSKIIIIWKIQKYERNQKDWLRTLLKLCWVAVKHYNYKKGNAISMNMKRVLSQALEYLYSQITSPEWSEVLSTDGKFGTHFNNNIFRVF